MYFMANGVFEQQIKILNLNYRLHRDGKEMILKFNVFDFVNLNPKL